MRNILIALGVTAFVGAACAGASAQVLKGSLSQVPGQDVSSNGGSHTTTGSQGSKVGEKHKKGSGGTSTTPPPK
jgi:hypothetical protein